MVARSLIALFLSLSVPLFAEPPAVELSAELATTLAKRVPLFAEIWEKDADAVLVGSVVRDYLFWCRRKALGGVDALRGTPLIDSREFLPADGAFLTVASKRSLRLPENAYGVNRLDVIAPPKADAKESTKGNPVDRFRLAQDGFRGTYGPTEITEFLAGHFPASPMGTGLSGAANAIRALDLLARDFYASGKTFSDDSAVVAATGTLRKPAEKALRAAATAAPLQSQPARAVAREQVTAAVREAYRARTERAALRALFDAAGANELFAALGVEDPGRLYLAARGGEPERAKIPLERLGVPLAKLLVPVTTALGGGKLFYGAPDDNRFRAAVLDGPLEGQRGDAGFGLYAALTPEAAAARAGGGERVIALRVSAEARLVDVTGGAGKTAFERYAADSKSRSDALADFGETLGVDVLRYGVEAGDVLVFNEAAVQAREGVANPRQTVAQLLRRMADVTDIAAWDALVAGIRASFVTARELAEILRVAANSPRVSSLQGTMTAVLALWKNEPPTTAPFPGDAPAFLTGIVGLAEELDRVLAAQALPMLAANADRRELYVALLKALATKSPEILAADYFLAIDDEDGARTKLAWDSLGSARRDVIAALKPGAGGAARERRAARLVELAVTDTDKPVRLAAIQADHAFLSLHGMSASGSTPTAGFLEPMLRLLSDSEPALRRGALQQMMYRWQVQGRAVEAPREVALVIDRLDDEYETVRRVAKRFFTGSPPAVAPEALAAFVVTPEGQSMLERESARPADANPMLRDVLRDAVVRAGLQSDIAKRVLAGTATTVDTGAPSETNVTPPRTPGPPGPEQTVDGDAKVLDERPAAEAPPPTTPAPQLLETPL